MPIFRRKTLPNRRGLSPGRSPDESSHNTVHGAYPTRQRTNIVSGWQSLFKKPGTRQRISGSRYDDPEVADVGSQSPALHNENLPPKQKSGPSHTQDHHETSSIGSTAGDGREPNGKLNDTRANVGVLGELSQGTHRQSPSMINAATQTSLQPFWLLHGAQEPAESLQHGSDEGQPSSPSSYPEEGMHSQTSEDHSPQATIIGPGAQDFYADHTDGQLASLSTIHISLPVLDTHSTDPISIDPDDVVLNSSRISTPVSDFGDDLFEPQRSHDTDITVPDDEEFIQPVNWPEDEEVDEDDEEVVEEYPGPQFWTETIRHRVGESDEETVYDYDPYFVYKKPRFEWFLLTGKFTKEVIMHEIPDALRLLPDLPAYIRYYREEYYRIDPDWRKDWLKMKWKKWYQVSMTGRLVSQLTFEVWRFEHSWPWELDKNGMRKMKKPKKPINTEESWDFGLPA
ncbi:hypothetical protein F4808DRAFT_475316 [Astrocystis sublimbata]|nr:hypothetical protein F4808DRAFT_475316 [Astrocystis sublimbata]